MRQVIVTKDSLGYAVWPDSAKLEVRRGVWHDKNCETRGAWIHARAVRVLLGTGDACEPGETYRWDVQVQVIHQEYSL